MQVPHAHQLFIEIWAMTCTYHSQTKLHKIVLIHHNYFMLWREFRFRIAHHSKELVSFMPVVQSILHSFSGHFAALPSDKSYPNPYSLVRNTHSRLNRSSEQVKYNLITSLLWKLTWMTESIHKYSHTPCLPEGSIHISSNIFLKGYACIFVLVFWF